MDMRYARMYIHIGSYVNVDERFRLRSKMQDAIQILILIFILISNIRIGPRFLYVYVQRNHSFNLDKDADDLSYL